jgi:hypothetical protein
MDEGEAEEILPWAGEEVSVKRPIDWKKWAKKLGVRSVPLLCFVYDASARFQKALDRYVGDPDAWISLEELRDVFQEEARRCCGDKFCDPSGGYDVV